MDLEKFLNSQKDSECPDGLTPALRGLWLDAKGEWALAHEAVQEESDPASAWVHAYLHRKEGDVSNAGYWYRRANRPLSQTSLQEEWREISQTLLGELS